MTIPFVCQRCLLHVDFEPRGDLNTTTQLLYPEGWTVVRGTVWRCATCVKEVAAGSPEKL